MNVQFAVKKEDGRPVVYVLEVNPRASRTVPFVSKATGVPLAKVAAKVMAGVSLAEQGYHREPIPSPRLGQGGRLPLQQVRRRGHRAGAGDEVHRRGDGHQRAVLHRLCQEPTGGRHGVARQRQDLHQRGRTGPRSTIVDLARRLEAMGYELLATRGTAARLEEAGIKVQRLKKISEGHPNVLDYMRRRRVAAGGQHAQRQGARTDEGYIRATAVAHGVPCITTIQAADAAVRAMEAMRGEEMTVQAVQDRFPKTGLRWGKGTGCAEGTSSRVDTAHRWNAVFLGLWWAMPTLPRRRDSATVPSEELERSTMIYRPEGARRSAVRIECHVGCN